VAEWFPKKDRAFATGIFYSSTSVGAILAPFIVGAVVSVEGDRWQIPFLFTGVLSSLWVFLWLKTYRKPEEHPQLSEGELAYINSDSEPENTEKIPWRKLLPKKETWAFSLTTITDGVWWFYLFWGAKFLAVQFNVGHDAVNGTVFVNPANDGVCKLTVPLGKVIQGLPQWESAAADPKDAFGKLRISASKGQSANGETAIYEVSNGVAGPNWTVTVRFIVRYQ
jgi:MFS family permease